MSDAVQEIRGLARDFAAAELRPHSERWDADGRLDDDVVPKLAELGFFGMLIPDEHGGMGFDAATYAAAIEELAWGEPAVALLVAHSALAADYIVRHGAPEQHERWLAALAAGESVGCIAFSEDDSGAPVAALVTQARRDGAGWRLQGRKRWVANGDRADLAVVLAGVDGGAEEGPALFVAARGDGFTPGARAATLGFRALGLVDVELDTHVTADARLGTFAGDPRDDDALGRLSVAAIALGIAQSALEHAIRYGGEREQFGQPIREFEGIQWKLAEMATRIAAARGLVAQAAADMHDTAASAMAKLAAAECAMYVTTDAVQIFGGYGYMRDYPVEKLMRDAKATEIMHGTNEAQRSRIARSLHS